MSPPASSTDPARSGRAATDTPDPDATVLGRRYEIRGLLGTGGMGAVYRALDLELGEVIALKMIRPELASDPDVVAAFRREVRLARRVTHRNVARTYDLGEADGFRFLTMELLEGAALSTRLAPGAPLPEATAIDIALAVCDGVAAAHDVGILHLDIKPANVMLADDGRIAVMDFGVARAVGDRPAQVMGTWAYMAPEQAEGDAALLDGRADQYAIGTLLFELVTGHLPFAAGAIAGLVARLTAPAPDPRAHAPGLDPRLAATINRCLARDRDERFDSVREVAAALRRRPGAAPPARPTPTPVAARPAAARRLIALAPLRTDGPDDVPFAEDLLDALHDRLATVEALALTPRSARPRAAGAHERGRELAALHGAHVLVDGSLRAITSGAPGVRRLALRLTGVGDGLTLGAVRLEGGLAELPRLVERAAAAICDALAVPRPVPARVLADPETLDLFLRGRREYVRFQPAANARAVELLRRAVERSPEDPASLAAYALAVVRHIGVGEPSPDQLARAREAATLAFTTAPDLVDAQVAMATVRLHEGDAPAAALLAASAVARAPRSADAHDLAARLLYEAGALDRAAHHAEHALHHEPRLASIRYLALRARALQGDWDDAIALVTGRVDASAPFSYWADRLRLSLWRGSTAWLAEDAPGWLDGLDAGEREVAAAACALIRTREVPPLIARALARATRSRRLTPRTRGFFRQLAAEVAAAAGDAPGAIAAITGAAEVGLFDAPWLAGNPLLAGVRDAPALAPVRAEVARRARAVIDALT